MKRSVWVFFVTVALAGLLSPGPVARAEEPADGGGKMLPLSPRVSQDALALLNKSGEALQEGNSGRARAFAESAVNIAPRLGAAHAALAGLLFDFQEFGAAEREFRVAVSLIERSDQPRLETTFWGTDAPTPIELAGNSHVRRGLCLLELARTAKRDGATDRERTSLRQAKDAFKAGLAREPSAELREVAKKMLARF